MKDTWVDKVMKLVVALGYMLAIIIALFLLIIAGWAMMGWLI
tara:strand:+ start:2639 stop:2764 length:126 start_codon:yes stop_codon:yes gene_type:complete